ncbi:hypothetical protein C8A00DRAFT_33792 [Chaetomidium leptoderma]|uniref:DUF7730 domain-containing protein n=1 Tax=Chaetomidium leptoderma TaxID=669021 RepID=A0AAN6VMC7_9PEZI|nr:hypothetical protein C8A00DRAFT_33792 [Chaetomidium leptoderma]
MRFGGCVRVRVSAPYPPLESLAPPPREDSLKWPQNDQTQSLFFKLPLELRRQILREVFGGRTLHIDLRSADRMYVTAQPGEDPFAPVRRGWRRFAPWVAPKPRITITYPKHVPLWRWYACFCHGGQLMQEGPIELHWRQPTFADGCCRGGAWSALSDRPDNHDLLPDGYGVGALGFLLSCQRACDEAMHILYSTNTITIENSILLLGLLQQNLVPGAPRLTGPGMQLMVSLEIHSSLILWNSRSQPREVEARALLAEQLDLLPRAFPNLRRLKWIPSKDVACDIIYGSLFPQAGDEGADLDLQTLWELSARNLMRLLDDVDELLLRPLRMASECEVACAEGLCCADAKDFI